MSRPPYTFPPTPNQHVTCISVFYASFSSYGTSSSVSHPNLPPPCGQETVSLLPYSWTCDEGWQYPCKRCHLNPHSMDHNELKDQVMDWSRSARGELQGKSFTLFTNFDWKCNLLLYTARWSQTPADNSRHGWHAGCPADQYQMFCQVPHPSYQREWLI